MGKFDADIGRVRELIRRAEEDLEGYVLGDHTVGNFDVLGNPLLNETPRKVDELQRRLVSLGKGVDVL